MDYWLVKSTPANTAKADALEEDVKLTEGTVVQVWMLHPEGCHGLAYAAIFEGGHQRWPHNPEDAYHGNDVPLVLEDDYELKAPALLKLKTWNLDDTYAHKVYIRITVLRGKIDVPTQALIDSLAIIRVLLTGTRTA